MTNKQQTRLLMEYEVRGSWWTCFCITKGLQRMAADYYIAKVRRKLIRYHHNTGGSSRTVLSRALYRNTKA
jgi:hypothetical protein